MGTNFDIFTVVSVLGVNITVWFIHRDDKSKCQADIAVLTAMTVYY